MPMTANSGPRSEAAEAPASLLTLAALALLVGGVSGAVCAAFRLTLELADRLRGDLVAGAHAGGLAGFVYVTAACGTATAVAAWLVRHLSPHASGSGVPHVEAVLDREVPPAPSRLVPVKFAGGALAMGAGLALGREGPSVQMGAGAAHLLGKVFRRGLPDCLVLLAAGAGAGLATAFNAPIAGAVFVLEELLRRFDARATIATFAASTGAIVVARWLLGNQPGFHVDLPPQPASTTVPASLALGGLLGCLGVAYNRLLLGALAAWDRAVGCPVELRAGLIGATVGALAWLLPGLVGGGDAITQRALDGADALPVLCLVFLLRFGLGAVSYAALTPGGLFAPMLVLGAQGGVIFGSACGGWLPGVAPSPAALGVIGMAAFFTAVVRSPLTGITLVTEMTGGPTLLLPMLGACFTAMLVPTLLGDPPIYDSLRERTLRTEKAQRLVHPR
jgi:chloride channel protein, CIC family